MRLGPSQGRATREGTEQPGAIASSVEPASLWDRVRAVRYPGAFAFVLFAATGALARAAYWDQPVGYDAGQYLYIGDVVLDGDTPYVDAANNKGPALFLAFALVRLVSGTSPLVVRIVTLLLIALAALALAAYVAKYAGRAAGLLTGVLLAVLTAAPDINGRYLYAANYDVAPMVGALWLASRGGRLSAAGAGALVAVATLMHPVFFLAAPFVVLEIWHVARRGQRVREVAIAVAGALAAAAPILLWIAAGGAFDDMLAQVAGRVQKATGEVSEDSPLDFPLQALTALALVGSAIAARDPRYRRLAIGAVLWIVGSWARLKVSGYTYPQHYFPAAPGIAAGLGLGLVSLSRPGVRYRVALAALPVLAALWLAVGRPAFDDLTGDEPALAYPDYGDIADLVRSNTAPDDPVLSGYPELYWLAERRAPTRFFDETETAARDSYESDRSRDLLRDPPAALVFDRYMKTTYVDELTRRYDYPSATPLQDATVFLRE
jgi:hypothetical protein